MHDDTAAPPVDRPPPPELPDMDVSDFRALGYVQEINRLFLHPLGLALYVFIDGDGIERLGGVLDARADPAGLTYDDLTPQDAVRAAGINVERRHRAKARYAQHGWVVQPLPEGDDRA